MEEKEKNRPIFASSRIQSDTRKENHFVAAFFRTEKISFSDSLHQKEAKKSAPDSLSIFALRRGALRRKKNCLARADCE